MVVLIRLVRIALLVVLAAIAISLVMAAIRPETGGVEKIVLAALVAACFAAGAGITSVSVRLRGAFER